MSIHKLSAGSGYDYLTRQVAALDATEKGHMGLASYYTERGESPGTWIGSGLAGIEGLSAADPVTAEQMKALFGAGMHPLATQRLEQLDAADLTDANVRAATQLGAPFKIYAGDVSPFRVEVAKRIAAQQAAAGQLEDESVSATDRARVRTEVAQEFFRTQRGRDPIDAREIAATIAKLSRPRTQTVAGYDLTFSPVKSVSTLWAVADPHIAAMIEAAHQAAVQDALSFIERHALFTRQGRNGAREVNVTGLVAAAFTHRDSRAGDPDLHTHVAVANKVQTLDGRWLSIDGRVLFKATVAASETYNTALEHRLRDRLGVRFAARPDMDPGKRPVREIVGVDPVLNQRWSSRRALIKDRQGELTAQFQRDHGRPPTPVEALQLAQQATLETRNPKHEPRSLAEQRAAWDAQAVEALGGPDLVHAMINRQAALVRAMCTSGARLQLAIAPAGAGKTTAMSTLARAWSDDGGQVLGLAPSAAAAAQLRDATTAPAETLAKLTWSIHHNDLPDWAERIDRSSLVIIDEAGMADTVSLDTAVQFIIGRGGSVRLVGDDQQLAAIGAGGVLRDIQAGHGAVRLNELHRFTDPGEAAATLAVREGRPEALGFYLDRRRVYVGNPTTALDAVFNAWQTDRGAGLDAIMLAPTRELVRSLNQRAQDHRLAGAVPGRQVELADGNQASVGDLIITVGMTAGFVSPRPTG
jgi:conjugative relaxase-like TrwC/TraI family protein